MSTKVTITDSTNSVSITTETYNVADAIRPWFPEAPADVTEAISELQTALDRDGTGADLADLEAYLGITVAPA